MPLLLVGAALYQHSMRPLGYLVWFMIGSFAHAIAGVDNSKISKEV